ncbi:hypothetical protein RCI31_000196 [Enterobacter hormaechei]|nr:hypothetical protein [Enterobacter hormaechei]
MKIRYLYGKSLHLNQMIDGKAGIRLSDLSHYSRLENEKMRDDEMSKVFIAKREEIIMEINGIRINPSDLTNDPIIRVTPRHCYCLCLSSKGDDDYLYSNFQADTCISFDVDMLEERLSIASQKFQGSFVVGDDIIYYSQTSLYGLGQTPEKLVFYKPDFFSHEREYRIAWFYPLDKDGFRAGDKNIPFMFENESSHLFFFHKEQRFITDCIIDVFKK